MVALLLKEQRKNILMFSRRHPVGHSLLEDMYIRILPARGWHVTWMLPHDEPEAGIKEVDIKGTRAFLYPRRPDAWHTHLQAVAALREQIESRRYDVVQVRNDWDTDIAALWTGRRTAHRCRIPFLFQASFALWFSSRRTARLDTSAKRVPRIIRTEIQNSIVKRLRPKADWIFPVSEVMKTELEEMGCDPSRMSVLPMGFDCSIKPENIDPGPVRGRYGLGDRPVAAYFGTMKSARRLDVLIEAFAVCLKKIPDAMLLMIGGGDAPADMEQLKQLCSRLGIRHNVVFTGQVYRGDVFPLIRASDFTISPYPLIPAFMSCSPTKLVESFMMARPVLGSAIPEQEHLIEGSGAGRIVAHTVDGYVESMIEYFSNREMTRELGGKGREYLEKFRDYNKIADELEELYLRLIRDKSGVSA